VQWDAGARTNYRVGYQGAYDLRVGLTTIYVIQFSWSSNLIYLNLGMG
jgi:hypothetical protein